MTTTPPANADVSGPLSQLWGCGDLGAWFNGAVKTLVPWSSAGRRKGEPSVPLEGVADLVAAPARLVEVDPRRLLASQPWVVRGHADYYTTGEWEITGRTSADMDQRVNRYPTFAERGGQLVILSGHHRSLAALIEGRPVLARVVGIDATAPVAVTPHLRVGPPARPHDEPDGDLDAVARRLRAGRLVTVGSAGEAAVVLRLVGLDADEIADRLHCAGLVNETGL